VDEMALEISASFVEMVFLISSVMLVERIELYLHNIISIDHNYDILARSYTQCRNAYSSYTELMLIWQLWSWSDIAFIQRCLRKPTLALSCHDNFPFLECFIHRCRSVRKLLCRCELSLSTALQPCPRELPICVLHCFESS
jgi:hypothetical protein